MAATLVATRVVDSSVSLGLGTLACTAAAGVSAALGTLACTAAVGVSAVFG